MPDDIEAVLKTYRQDHPLHQPRYTIISVNELGVIASNSECCHVFQNSLRTTIGFFPLPEDAEYFFNTETAPLGWKPSFPGAVGILGYSIVSSKKLLRIDVMQNLYSYKSPMPFEVRSKYINVRVPMLEYALKDALAAGVTSFDYDSSGYHGAARKFEHVKEIFEPSGITAVDSQ
jgi:hypothetical protein